MTFLSDFGLKDAYVAQVKAVILSRVPDAVVIDITHEIPPFGIISAGWLLATSFRHFPTGTIHLAVVDPGVGTNRAILALRKEGHVFIGPDNGLFSFLYPSEEILEITWRPEGPVSATFHGRDTFAPLVVRFLTGHGLGAPGILRKDPVRFETSLPMVAHIDVFGNVITNIGCDRLGEGTAMTVNSCVIRKICNSFSEIPEGDMGLICGSAGTIEIAANRARASDMIGAQVGMAVSINPS